MKGVSMTLKQKALVVAWVERGINLFVSALVSGLGQIVARISTDTKPEVVESSVVNFIYDHPHAVGQFANVLGFVGIWVTIIIGCIDMIYRDKSKE